MENLPALITLVHALAAVVWVGGMFFAYVVLRPSLGFLEPPNRLSLWSFVFKRFFAWVWAALIVLLSTGYHMVFAEFHGFDQAGIYIHAMHGIALIMTALFLFLFFVPYQRFRAYVDAEDWADAAGQLNLIRRIVATNLALGLLNVAIGSSGRFWG
jgi:uncharacterized membrane protein